MLQRVTRCYKRWQRVSRGEKGLQGLTRIYRVLQEVAWGDKGLQGVTSGDKR